MSELELLCVLTARGYNVLSFSRKPKKRKAMTFRHSVVERTYSCRLFGRSSVHPRVESMLWKREMSLQEAAGKSHGVDENLDPSVV